MKTGLYVHLPFCRQKCNYCDFASFAGCENLIDPYLGALAAEAVGSALARAETLYVGGGTPSVLSAAQLERLCHMLSVRFGALGRFTESTFEANPESVDETKLSLLKSAGFNRLSLGLQSLDDAELKALGRVHDRACFLHAYETARRAGFTNINVDLIAGLPGQTLDAFLKNLDGVLALAPEHISVYGLQIEEGTPFFERGLVCDQPLMRTMLEETHHRLTRAGLEHYEISNFARPGYRALHNTHYWNNGEYLGLGSAAASYLGGERRQNTPDVRAYIACAAEGKSPVVFAERLTGKAKLGETLMLALRQLDGVDLTEEALQVFGAEIDRQVADGLLARSGNHIKLTFEGLFLANEVFCSFVAPFEDA